MNLQRVHRNFALETFRGPSSSSASVLRQFEPRSVLYFARTLLHSFYVLFYYGVKDCVLISETERTSAWIFPAAASQRSNLIWFVENNLNHDHASHTAKALALLEANSELLLDRLERG